MGSESQGVRVIHRQEATYLQKVPSFHGQTIGKARRPSENRAIMSILESLKRLSGRGKPE